jgi:hypothetical protein
MYSSIIVDKLDSTKGDEIKSAISSISSMKGKDKVLPLVFSNTTGDLGISLELAKLAHTSKVDLLTEAHGIIDASGCVLFSAGLKGERHASIDTIFKPFDSEVKSQKGERLSPQNQSILSALKTFEVHGKKLKGVISDSQELSSFEAKSLRIVDKVDKLESKYRDKSSNKKKSSKKK